MKKFEKIVQSLTWWASCIGQVSLFGAMIVVVANILLREFWRPLPGTVEMTEIFGAILLAMGVAYCALLDGHISVDIFVSKLPARLRAFVDGITSLIAFIFLAALAGRTIISATRMLERGATTSHLGIPNYPIGYLVSFGFIMLAVVLLLNFIKKVIIIAKGSET